MRSSVAPDSRSVSWQSLILLLATAWLGASLLLDLWVMPSLYGGGMMTQAGFASTGYMLFGGFNHVELIFGALLLTGLLVMTQQPTATGQTRWRVLWPALLLLLIPAFDAYGLTPIMSALGLSIDGSVGEAPAVMGVMHGAYWGLELLKIGAIALLIHRFSGRLSLTDAL